MSLINEALKKAQLLRHEQQAAAGAPEAAGGRVEKRGRPLPAQLTLVLVASGAVLVVFSVVFTVYFLNRTPDALPPPPAAHVPVITRAAPSPVIVAPVPKISASEKESSPAVVARAGSKPVTESAKPQTAPAANPVTAAPIAETVAPRPTASGPAAPPAVASPAHHPLPDPKIQNFVDSVRVTGIRSYGADSKVLMNDRVYRINDIVNADLGVKLVKVAPDAITFADANGVIYKKYF